MRKKYERWEPQIRDFFKENSLDYNRAKECGKGIGIIGGQTVLFLQKIDGDSDCGLLAETPAPVVLKAVEENGKLIFEKTEHTDEYFCKR